MGSRIPATAICLAASLLVVPLLPAALRAAEEPAPIQDNSFLIEEAYNQEPGVVQHIQTFSRARRGGGWLYTFTQEWPLRGQRHQLSYTLPYERAEDGAGAGKGMGDVAINYRLQLLGSGEEAVALSPRFSLLLPTGDERRGRGAGALGYQVNLPLSVVLGPRAVTHVNLGATWTPGAKNAAGEEADLDSYQLGQSFVWLLAPRVNLLVELAYASEEEVAGRGVAERAESFSINPGVRWAHDLPGGLQVVPGLALTLGAGPSAGERAYFFYLSFEHPFRQP
jgi:hypothetical protein